LHLIRKYIHNKLLIINLALLPSISWGQDTAEARRLLQSNQLAAAKEQVDIYLAGQDNVSGAGGWLLKADIYAAIGTDAQWKYLVPDGREVALAAIRTAVQMDAETTGKRLKANGYSPLPALYRGWVTEGTGAFNAATERKLASGYAQALDLFKKALTINTLCAEQGWMVALQPNVAVTRYNAAQSAINAGNEDAALLYARQLADAGLTMAGPYQKADFCNIYQWLVNYYHQKQDAANLQAYAIKGGKIYPDTPYFTRMLLNSHQAVGDKEHLLLVMAYDRAVQKFTKDDDIRYGYCASLYMQLYKFGAVGHQKTVLSQKLEQNLSKYLQNQPDSARGWLLMGKHWYNTALDLQKVKPGDKTVQAAFAEARQHLQRAIDLMPDKTSPVHQQGIQLLEKIRL
jgi:hypothetical protein